MSLSLPDSYNRSNISENWLFQIFNSRDSFLSLDGIDDYIDYGTTNASSPIAITSSTGISVSFWINFPELENRENIFASNSTATYSGYWIEKNPDDKIAFNWGDDTGAGSSDRRTMIGSTVLSANTWYHVLITSTFANATSGTQIYINNVAETISDSGSASVTTPTYVSDGKAYIGREDFTATNYGGKLYLKNLAIWAGVLDSNNRTAIYNNGVTRSLLSNFGNYTQSSALKAYWEFNNAETYSEDLTGNVSKGNITGGTYGGFLPLSYKDTMVDNVFYHGSIIQSGAVRDSIDLKNSKAKSSNLSFQCSNFSYKNSNLLSDLLFSDNFYINKTIRVFSQPDNDTSLSNCIQIYNGRLNDINTNSKEIISFNLSSQRPWDFISIPKDRTPVTKTYIPLVYGDYTPNVSFLNTPAFCDTELYPVPVLRINDEEIITLMPRAYSASSNSHMNMYQGQDAFIPLATDSGGVDDETTTQFENTNTIRTKLSKKAVGTIRGREATDTLASGTEFSDMHNAFDGDANTFSTVVVPSNGLLAHYLMGLTTGISDKFHEHDIINIDLSHKYSVNDANISLFIAPAPYAGGTETSTTPDFVADTLLATPLNIVSSPAGNQKVSVPYKLLYTNFDNAGTISINDIKVTIKTEFFAGDADEDENDKQSLSEIKFMYSGGDGLTAFNNWKTADSGLIKYGHEAHRDLLARFTNFNFDDSDIYNWSSNLNINSLRNNWSIRWWALKPVELEKTLEKIQKEFGFIFKWRPDGSPSYWAIKNSYASSDVVSTLKWEDISNINISHTSFSDLITKMDIKYKMHPATSEKLLSQESLDSTTSPSPREKWNIKDKENIQSVELDYNYEKQGNIDVGSGNPNDGYADYYMNIFGDIKKTVSCSVVNPSKGYKLETGDIVKFDIDKLKPFGSDWDNYYMITTVQRSLGKIKITCREVG
jgi:hypothetical protein